MAQQPQINYLLTFNSTDGLNYEARVNQKIDFLDFSNRQNWIRRILSGKK